MKIRYDFLFFQFTLLMDSVRMKLHVKIPKSIWYRPLIIAITEL